MKTHAYMHTFHTQLETKKKQIRLGDPWQTQCTAKVRVNYIKVPTRYCQTILSSMRIALLK